MPDTLKRCSRCGKEKPFSEFNRRRASGDGRQAWCRDCSAAVLRERRISLQTVKPRRAAHYPELDDPDWVRQKYVTELLRPDEIAAALECSVSTVYAARRRHGIPLLPRTLRDLLRTRRTREEVEV